MCNRCRQTYLGTRCPCRPAWEGSRKGRAGSTRAWRALRTRQLADHPICQTPGCTALATEVDHRVNVAAGGTDDPSNLQSLCAPHHRAKTQAEAHRGAGQHRETP
ncbi:HNH endonuclease [Gordonia tangerina]|uniref:HNH endonuclease n=1 Tax=Gordonia tangerina TaxID=2911060 RepID=UPI0035584C17